MIAKGSKIGLHSILPGAAMPLVRAAAERGAIWPLVKGVDNAGLAIEVKAASPQTFTITRFVREREDAAQGIDQWDDQQIEDAAHASVQIVFDRTNPDERAAADWFEILNEADPPGVLGWQKFGRLCRRVAEIATDRGIRVALPAFNAGTPEYDEMWAFVGTGCLQAMKAGGHILTIHEGVFGLDQPVTHGFGDLIPGAGSVPDGAGSLVGRYRYLYDFLPAMFFPQIVVSEFYAGGGYQQAPASVVGRLAWADRLYRSDPNVLAVLPFTIDPSSGWVHQNYTYAYGAVLDYLVAEKDKTNVAEPIVADISKYQFRRIDPLRGNWEPANWVDDIDWDEFAGGEVGSGAQAVIVRVGDGLNKDPAFDRIIAALKARGIPWGIYHLWRANIPAALQVAKIKEWCPEVPPCGVWGDAEFVMGLIPRSNELFLAFDDYLHGLDSAYDIITGIYSGAWFLDPNFTQAQQEHWALEDGREAWLSGYPNLFIPIGWRNAPRPCLMHQFTDSWMYRGFKRRADANRIKAGAGVGDLIKRRNPKVNIMFYVRGQTEDPALAGAMDALVQAAIADIETNQRCLAYGQAFPGTEPPPPDPVECPFPYQARALQNLSLRDLQGNSMAGAIVPAGAVVTVHMILSHIGPPSPGGFDNRAVLAADGRNCWAAASAIEKV